MSEPKRPSHTLLKSINQQKVLHLIFSECPISRVELARKTGLSQQTVTNIVHRLLEDKVIIEGEPQSLESGSGRKRVPLLINGSRFCAIGIELSGTSARGAVYNFRHERLADTAFQEERYETEDDLLRVIRVVVDRLIARVPDGCEIKGIGFSVHGLVDSSEGILLRSPGLGWKRVPIAQLLETEYGVPVFLENDTNLLAVHENLSGSLRASRNNVTLKFDRGIGGAIVVEKQLVTGSSFVAGELGHYKAFGPPFDFNCYCRGKGCLTTLASTRGMLLSTGRTFESFEAELRSSDPKALELREIIKTAIIVAVSNIVTLLNPDRVLIIGRVLPALGDSFAEELETRVLANVPETCRNIKLIRLKEMPDETVLAVGLVLQSVFKIPLESLSL